jgi:hypothetical protein
MESGQREESELLLLCFDFFIFLECFFLSLRFDLLSLLLPLCLCFLLFFL